MPDNSMPDPADVADVAYAILAEATLGHERYVARLEEYRTEKGLVGAIRRHHAERGIPPKLAALPVLLDDGVVLDGAA